MNQDKHAAIVDVLRGEFEAAHHGQLQKQKGEITQGFIDKRLYNTTVHIGEVMRAELGHRAELIEFLMQELVKRFVAIPLCEFEGVLLELVESEMKQVEAQVAHLVVQTHLTGGGIIESFQGHVRKECERLKGVIRNRCTLGRVEDEYSDALPEKAPATVRSPMDEESQSKQTFESALKRLLAPAMLLLFVMTLLGGIADFWGKHGIGIVSLSTAVLTGLWIWFCIKDRRRGKKTTRQLGYLAVVIIIFVLSLVVAVSAFIPKEEFSLPRIVFAVCNNTRQQVLIDNPVEFHVRGDYLWNGIEDALANGYIQLGEDVPSAPKKIMIDPGKSVMIDAKFQQPSSYTKFYGHENTKVTFVFRDTNGNSKAVTYPFEKVWLTAEVIWVTFGDDPNKKSIQ
jgi:hypothetical protein